MPYYNDVPYYYGGGAYATHSSLITSTGRTPFHTPLSRFSPHLSTISESPLNHLHRFSPISVRHPRRVIDTADIDVSSPRILTHDGNRPGNRLRRDRPTIKIRSQALKDNPALREHYERHEKSVGELLMEKFFIKDKKRDGDGDGGAQIRLYHQVSLDDDFRENSQEHEDNGVHKGITRRFTRRRSSADLQLDPEQLQREATYAQVQAKVLDSLVAEEQAQIENEARRGTLIKKRKTSKRLMTNGANAYDRNDSATNADSDPLTQEEEGQEEEAAAARIRKTMKKAKRKKKPDKDPMNNDIRTEYGRSSTSSEMSTESKIEEWQEEEEKEDKDKTGDGPKPQMYKIEACNSVGDFSTIWMNANSEKRDSTQTEQFRESVRVPVPRKFQADKGASACPKRMEEAEAQVVLSVRKPYVKDPSRHSVYLTVRKPTGKLDEKLDAVAKSDKDQPSQMNGFESEKINSTTSKDCTELTNGESKMASAFSGIEDAALNEARKIESSQEKRDAIVLKTKSDVQRVSSTVDAPSPKNAVSGTAMNSCSIRPSVSAFVPTYARKDNAQIEQSTIPSKDVFAKTVKKRVNQRDDNATEEDDTNKCPEAVSTAEMSSVLATGDSVTSRTRDKLVEERDLQIEPEMTTTTTSTSTSRKGVEEATRRSVARTSIEADDNVENSASSTKSVTGRLPKPSKINTDRNNAVQAPELSLRETEAEYLANSSKSVEDVVVAGTVGTLPGKKANKAWNLARLASSDTPKKANGVDVTKSTLNMDADHQDDTAKSEETTTLLKETTCKMRNNDRDEKAKLSTDVKPAKNNDLAKAPRNEKVGQTNGNVSEIVKEIAEVIVEAPKQSTVTSREAKPSKDRQVDIKEISGDVGKDLRYCSDPKSKVTKPGGIESRLPKVTTFPKTSVDTLKSTGDRSSNASNPVSSNNATIPKTLEQKTTKVSNKVTEKKLLVTAGVNSNKSQEEGQLSKSASTESIDFWSEIKAPGSPEATRSKQWSEIFSHETTIPAGVEGKANPANPKWISSDSPSTNGESSTVLVKEYDDKKNETVVEISGAPLDSLPVESSDVAVAIGGDQQAEKITPATKTTKAQEAEERVTIQAKVTSEIERNEVEKPTTVRKGPPPPLKKKKKSNLSIAIDSKDPNRTVKKAPVKREDSTDSSIRSNPVNDDTTPVASAGTPTPTPRISVPLINIVEAPKLPEEPENRNLSDEEHEDPSTPTNEPHEPCLMKKISKWSNQHDLTNANDVKTPLASEETSLAASPTVSPPSSKTKRVIRKKKSSTKKAPTNEKGPIHDDSKTSTKTTLTEKQLLPKPSPKVSPKSSPRNSPSQRPLDLMRMFYTTPSALLTATPRDLSKVKRAKIKRRRHHSRTPSVSSDSTGSTTSTATTESTDGSGSTCTELDDDPEHKRMNSTRSNDSGFDGSPRISTPSQSSDNQRNSDSSDHFTSGRITPPATNLPRFKKYAVTDFNFLKVLGKGSFGKVLLAELRGTECVYAVKCLKKDVVLEDDDVECTLIERKVLTLATRHPYLCHLFCTFQTESHLFFVMEYLNGGDLMFHIQKSGRFPEVRARFYAAEIWSGLNFLHKKGIVYRDLKLDNVLLDFEGHIRIADFGMCKLQIFLDRTADTFCGTPDYMAPEIIKGLKYNQSVDWWSFGVLLYEMLTGQSPFSGCDEDELFWSICNERPFIPRYLSQEATDMLVCLLEKDSGKRPPGHDIAMHAFFQQVPWDRLERRQLEPPFKPALDHTLDTKYFDTAFTAERPRLTPVPEQILTSMDQGVFRGFSYTNPNATD
ncbi:hypothetical protein DMN91_001834 [Ooceraea biroi]|uniref:protein kinase C n=1 Tax=Ooceraea biroi TaxID=2015173 RepID=A0A3L8DZ10_OOCBI|nr:uncharacterized protein LOC105287941 isoform X1 [Ooceraea biroi]RLU25677.1 hypothetical protein DMN91_001834 [Ooceraea biroi]